MHIIVILAMLFGIIFFMKKVIELFQEASDAYNENAEKVATKKDKRRGLRKSIQPIYHRPKAQKTVVAAEEIFEAVKPPQKRVRYVPKFKQIESIFDTPDEATKPKITKKSKAKARMGFIAHSNLKKAIVWKEVLDKPIALRNLQ